MYSVLVKVLTTEDTEITEGHEDIKFSLWLRKGIIFYTARSNSLGREPWAGPTTPRCSISSTIRAARL